MSPIDQSPKLALQDCILTYAELMQILDAVYATGEISNLNLQYCEVTHIPKDMIVFARDAAGELKQFLGRTVGDHNVVGNCFFRGVK